MVVRKGRLQRTDLREATSRRRRLHIDIKWRDRSPVLGEGHRSRITVEPEVLLGVILRRKRAALLGPAHHADNVGHARALAFAARIGVLPALGDKAAIDDDKAAA